MHYSYPLTWTVVRMRGLPARFLGGVNWSCPEVSTSPEVQLQRPTRLTCTDPPPLHTAASTTTSSNSLHFMGSATEEDVLIPAADPSVSTSNLSCSHLSRFISDSISDPLEYNSLRRMRPFAVTPAVLGRMYSISISVISFCQSTKDEASGNSSFGKFWNTQPHNIHSYINNT